MIACFRSTSHKIGKSHEKDTSSLQISNILLNLHAKPRAEKFLS